MTQIDPDLLLASVRRAQRRADDVAARARARLGVRATARRDGVETAMPPSRGDFRVAASHPLKFLYPGVVAADEVKKDMDMFQRLLHVFKTSARARSGSRSIVQLPSGRKFGFTAKTGEISKL